MCVCVCVCVCVCDLHTCVHTFFNKCLFIYNIYSIKCYFLCMCNEI